MFSDLFFIKETEPRADNFINDVLNFEAREAPKDQPAVRCYGTAGMGLDVAAEAWPNMNQVFCSEDCDPTIDTPGQPTMRYQPTVQRTPVYLLRDNPIDLLLLGDLSPSRSEEWRVRISHATTKPSVI
jgi:hypothetical protein